MNTAEMLAVLFSLAETNSFLLCFPQQRAKKRIRVNKVATNLLKLLPTKGAIDLSYLLENNKRQRKKTAAFAS